MGKARSASEKKEAILNAALHLFAVKGYAGTSTKELAQESGVTEGLIFYYYGDKSKLLQQVIRRFSFFESVHLEVDKLEHLEGEAALQAYGKLYLEFLDRHRPFLMLIWSPELMQHPVATEEVGSLLQGMRRQTAALLLRALKGMNPDRETLEAGASMLLSSLLTYALTQSRFGERTPEQDAQFMEQTAGIILRGIRTESNGS